MIAQIIGLTGSVLKKTKDVCVSINQRFFHEVQPIPAFVK